MKTLPTTLTIVAALILFNGHSVLAQLTIQPVTGYQWALAGGTISFDYSFYITDEEQSQSQTIINGSAGQGFTGGLDVQYKFCPYFDLDLGGRYWGGAAINHYANYIPTDAVTAGNTSYQDNLHMTVFSLGDFYDVCNNHKLTPFMGIGLDCGTGNIKSIATSTGAGYIDVGNANTTIDAAFGVYIELGLKYRISSHFSILAQLRGDVLSITPSIGTLESYSVNGGPNIVGTLTTSERQVDYVNNLSANNTLNGPSTSPSEEPAYKIPASAWGVTVGVAYTFGKRTKAVKTK